MNTGNLIVEKLPYRGKHPVISGYTRINVCSSGKKLFRQLSPMLLGPVYHEQFGLPPAHNLENLWQFSKIFNSDLDEIGNIKPEFYTRRISGFNDPKPHRHVKRESSLYFLWNSRRMEKIEARKKIYCRYYAKNVVKTGAYRQLKRMLTDSENILIVGYDGHHYDASQDTNGKILNSYLYDLSRPFGHEFVLVGLLTGNRVWQ